MSPLLLYRGHNSIVVDGGIIIKSSELYRGGYLVLGGESQFVLVRVHDDTSEVLHLIVWHWPGQEEEDAVV